MVPAPIRVLLIDHHDLFLVGVRHIIALTPDLAVIGTARSGEEGLRLLAELDGAVDVVVTDLALPGLSGLELMRRAKATHPALRVLLLASDADGEQIRGLVAAGIDGYVLKQGAVEDLLAAIRAVARGEAALAPIVARRLLAQLRRPERTVRIALSTRERQVLRQLADGRTSKEIASELGLSSNTIDNHRARLLTKLGAENTPAAIRIAARQGLLSIPDDRG